MDLFSQVQSEQDPIYQQVQEQNYNRYFSFLRTMIEVAIARPTNGPRLTHDLIKAVNFHAIVGLHAEAGQYRTARVSVGRHTPSGSPEITYEPPPPGEVTSLMNQVVDGINYNWERIKPLALATFALWRINHIHPFRNGNGRTARAVCYFILCVKSGGLLHQGTTNLIELLQTEPHRQQYYDFLKAADEGDLAPLLQLIESLIGPQLKS